MLRFLDLFKKSSETARIPQDESTVQHKYRSFTSLLKGNNHALELITELESLLYEGKSFSLSQTVSGAEQLIGTVYDIVEDLNALSGGKYTELFDSTERIGVVVLRELVKKRRFQNKNLVLPLERLSHENVDVVGGKAANLGEISNRVYLPVPKGFSITAWACHYFLKENRLIETIESLLKGLNIQDTQRLEVVGEEIRSLIMKAKMPAELERYISQEAASMLREFGPDLRFSVRSSATCEDSEATFAGQHATVLNVRAQNIARAYREVVASTFNPRAIFYRRNKGYADEDVIMCVLCIMMVNARTSGVMYTVDPNNPDVNDVIISGVWGLGVSVVDGSAETDFFKVSKTDRKILGQETVRKTLRLVMSAEEGIIEQAVPKELQEEPCLTESQVQDLVNCGLRLEEHYGQPLDIEWAVDQGGKLYILQARPLNRFGKTGKPASAEAGEQVPGREMILHAGQTASPGTGSGMAYVLHSDHLIHHIPKGTVLVSRQTSPAYVSVMGRVKAIVTDVGSITGHMASVAREFGIPTLVGTGKATTTVAHGEEITVDATNRFVYRGRVDEILSDRPQVNLMKGSPVFKLVQEVMKKIAPLNLIDPRKDNFKPAECRTLHDIIRFAHEMAMQEMFRIGDEFHEDEALAVHLKVGLPMNMYVIDLGGGLETRSENRTATLEDVRSVPFKALLRGMTHPNVQWQGGVGLNLSGFASIVAESVFRDPVKEGRMGGPNYAVVSGEYLNFNARLGYHFATVDTFCGPRVNDNYILFSFKGGAADIGRRSRRATLIAMILKRLDFRVEQKGDLIRGELKKYDSNRTEEKLDYLGRMLGSVRLLDMVLSDDGQLDWYVKEFFLGNYTFTRPEERHSS
ncbi:MAG: PEP/pyruvate-binding domain-containing protein [Desulfovibrionales bacterium]